MLNSRDISLLRQDVAANCRVWLERCRAAGLKVLITNTVRDREYQEFLYARGRTRPGTIVTNGRIPTFHSDAAGLAWDFCQNIQGQEYSDPAFFRTAAELAKEMGFSWGGDWRSFPDSPHIQWDAGKTWTSTMILAGKLPPPMPLFAERMKRLLPQFSMHWVSIFMYLKISSMPSPLLVGAARLICSNLPQPCAKQA